jgi:hypothetical protein
MTEPLKSGDQVIYNDIQYTVKLNGTTVYLTGADRKLSLSRTVAEKLKRVGHIEPRTSPKLQPKAKPAASPPLTEKKTAETRDSRLRALIADKLKDQVDVDDLIRRVSEVFVNTNKVGGVYMLRITEIAGQPLVFRENGKETDDYVLIKFGRADDFKKRFGQFKFKFTEVLRIDGDTTMEAELKKMIPANWVRYYYGAANKRGVMKALGIKGNNGPTEWRLMTKKTHDAIVAKAATITSLNWKTELALSDAVKLDKDVLALKFGKDELRANTAPLELF